MAADSPGSASIFYDDDDEDTVVLVTVDSYYSSESQHLPTDGDHVSNADGSARCQLYQNGQFTMIHMYYTCHVYSVEDSCIA